MNECGLEQLVTTMKEGIENATIDNNELKILWKKTFGYRRSYIRSHTANEVLEKFPGYSYPFLVSIFRNYFFLKVLVNEILPRLFDKLPNNSLYVMGEKNVKLEKHNKAVVLSIASIKRF